MSFEQLQNVYNKSNIYKEIEHKIFDLSIGNAISIKNLAGSLKSLTLSLLLKNTKDSSRFIIVTSSKEEAKEWYYDLLSLIGNEQIVLLSEAEKHIRIQNEQLDENTLNNIDALASIQHRKQCIIITTPQIYTHKVPKPHQLQQYRIAMKRGNTYSFTEFTNGLMLQGFERKELVENQGDISIRGGIVDVFPLGYDSPLRFEFWGNEIESIREFDPLSQRSIREFEEIEFIGHLYHQQDEVFSSSFLDYISHDSSYFILDQKEQVSIVFHSLNADDVLEEIHTYKVVELDSLGKADIEVDAVQQPNFSSSLSGLAVKLRSLAAMKMHLFLCADGQANKKRFNELLHTHFEYDEDNEEHEQDDQLADPEYTLRRIKWSETSLSKGFILNKDNIGVFTEHQLFERQHFQPNKRGKRFTGITLRELAQLHRGDFVVHVDKGIGKYDGLVTLEINNTKQECIRILYLGGDVLFVHMNHIHKIQKYSAAEDGAPRLSKLGSAEWERKKEKTKKKLKDIARELIKLYAKRKSEPGYKFPEDTQWQKEFEASFMYEDTPDQSKATIDVKSDMQSSIPMDRLVCGDVGFGKTEVAIRAAFKAAQSGKQVAVLVPTTILAHQHFNTFSDRLRRFPINVDVISRFRNTADQKLIIEKVKNGGIDILIGTHRILSKDIQFRNLGLLIIDEEQRFGVTAKEKLRYMRVSVDTLTLTATPIPRTLNFSLMGARDLSVIETPPRNRLPVYTEITEWEDDKIKDAIIRELSRGGQIFFVNDKIAELDRLHQKLLALVPSLRCATAHGQMETELLENVMEKFLEKKIDCLLSTKIVESGLDIPNANTIFIHNADNFGLAELYQLRGRVGRSNTQAYCTLIVPPIKKLTPTAVKRLQALEEHTDLGSGFQLAMRDMEIRGAGNLLGAEQSGFIADMGFELYQQIVEESVNELKEEEFSDLFKGIIDTKKKKVKVNQEISIDIGNDSLLPSSYIKNDTERFDYYKKLYNVRSETELHSIHSELRDRFGSLPQEAENLLFAVRLRILSMELGFIKVALANNILAIELPPESNEPFYEYIFPVIVNSLHVLPSSQFINSGKKVLLHISLQHDKEAIDILLHLKHLIEHSEVQSV